jgi:UDP-3-O-[3-hydroxymyristoyl] N-acetylglucosamine deacetylase / 3-hydroxyacyl-[acyl-carrier-protein] dehydratase
MEKQRTIKEEIKLPGRGLHTGNNVSMTLKPAEENRGINFVRLDLAHRPMIRACVENVIQNSAIPRCTSIGSEGVVIFTIEHLMSALYGLGIDNLSVEIDNNELPGLDGSGNEFYQAIKRVGIEEQSQPREFIDIQEPISVNSNGASILMVPDREFKIHYVLNYPNPFLQAQFFSAVIDPETFEREIAPCRTFCLEQEALELQAQGLGKGANYTNTLVVGEDGVIGNTVKFSDEFARHKVLDFIGDIYLLGKPIHGQVFAFKSGHYLNLELVKKILKQRQVYAKRSFLPENQLGDRRELDIHQIMKILPHRYPFLLVDRIIEMEKGKRAVGIKNVTANEEFFQGHFPTRPVMPGVLMIEAMAQTGGVLILTNEAHYGKVALFMATDKVKFRKLVEPGDQLVMEVEVLRDKDRMAQIRGVAKVENKVVAEAEMVFSFIDASFLNRS